jgi:hypothetical protein
MHGLDFYCMFAPDILHEFELGVWKATFTHLLHLLYCADHANLIQIINNRCVSVKETVLYN